TVRERAPALAGRRGSARVRPQKRRSAEEQDEGQPGRRPSGARPLRPDEGPGEEASEPVTHEETRQKVS
ncbi:MAG TPA: hypothetical protein VN520_06125, partial [Streptomyces sp.]|nr:hypothetical protein [Streptomyces sp.]